MNIDAVFAALYPVLIRVRGAPPSSARCERLVDRRRLNLARCTAPVLAIALLALASTSLPTFAKEEYRKPAWTWRLWGGDAADFDSPEEAFAAFNTAGSIQFDTCSARNCGGCAKDYYSGTSKLGPYPTKINGQLNSVGTGPGIPTATRAPPRVLPRRPVFSSCARPGWTLGAVSVRAACRRDSAANQPHRGCGGPVDRGVIRRRRQPQPTHLARRQQSPVSA